LGEYQGLVARAVRAAVDDRLRVIEGLSDRESYRHDIGDVPPLMTGVLFNTLPHCVVQPESAAQILGVLRYADEHGVAVVPRGAASWGFGGVIPTRAGIVIDLSPFRKVTAFDAANKTVTVQAGARWSDIDTLARQQGLALMTYPSSKFSTVGGWIATGGYGINSFRHGHISRQIVDLTVATPAEGLRKLTPADPDFQYFVSTEGTLGVIVEVTLRLRENPRSSFPRLLYFPDESSALAFVGRLTGAQASLGIQPNVIRFLDRNHLHDTNKVIRARIFKETAAVLVEFDIPGDDAKFTAFLAGETGVEEAPKYASSYLWNERLFGMKTKRLGPTILASEVIIPTERAAAFVSRAQRLGRRFGVEIAVDAYVLDARRVLVMTTFLCDSRRLRYYVNLPLVSMLTRMAVRLGAEPYGLGIWNAPFVNHRYNNGEIAALRTFKARVDPRGIMNPGKFPRITSRWLSIPAAVFHPAIFGPAMTVMTVGAPVMGRLFTLLLGKDHHVDKLDVELSTHACAKCGNCIAVCPAYLVTRNEAVTAKGKLALARKLIQGREVTREEAANAFLCMHCKACEEICQTNLEQMSLWAALESRLTATYGRPEERISEFLKAVDGSREYWEMVERNALSAPQQST
jgi:FAD/FMN-containing dehydrogenase/ferredoxin